MRSATFLAYTPYGHFQDAHVNQQLLGFNGEVLEKRSGTYLLGNGYRPYSPAVMRFLAPDSWSPFGRGGRNAYAYCAGEPINRLDPSGHVDISGMRRVANPMRDRARAIETRRVQQQPAQQRVAELRQRLAQRQQAQVPQPRNRNPLAQGGGDQHFAHLATNQRGPQGNGPLASRQPSVSTENQMTVPEAVDLYDRLTTALGHEQTYINNLNYVAPGTEIRRQYDADIARIRTDIADIRDRLGVHLRGGQF
ncbi:RHS repeat-associated core domain-containing protein [Pseudomonas sp. NPDC089395]|uniref:RHS repeat-associated core domain-containing protein n=1 Tax=Pseudomonas sp. NPDC089395 TaxID=3364460 RepID=UPI00381CB1FC